jgi:hypothetical protein
LIDLSGMNDLFWPLICFFATLGMRDLSNVPIHVFHRMVETRSMSWQTLTDPEAHCPTRAAGKTSL